MRPSSLLSIRDEVQRVADAISMALGIETEIVDQHLMVIAGTGRYRERVGQYEEHGNPDLGYLYGRVIRQGVPFVIRDARHEANYTPLEDGMLEPEEQSEICCPIVDSASQVIGLIGLVAFTDAQHRYLLERESEMRQFLQEMANLLAARVLAQEHLVRLDISHRQLSFVLDHVPSGVLLIDGRGTVLRVNRQLRDWLPCETWPGTPLAASWPDLDAARCLAATAAEDFECAYETRRFAVKCLPFHDGSAPGGALLWVSPMEAVHEMIYTYTNPVDSRSIEDTFHPTPWFDKMKRTLAEIAENDRDCFISGERGTGKRLLAQFLHFRSLRRAQRVMLVTCDNSSEDILERTLFGYEEGGTVSVGVLELAGRGTVILRGVEDLSLRLQQRLIDAMKTGTFLRVNGLVPIALSARLIALSPFTPDQLVHQVRFRPDLMFRLAQNRLTVPPLRERRRDIAVLARHFLRRNRSAHARHIDSLDPDLETLLTAYAWPENIRELESAIDYAASLETLSSLTTDSMPPHIKEALMPPSAESAANHLVHRVRMFERHLVEETVAKYGWTVQGKRQAARELAISVATLYRKLGFE